MPAPEVCLSWRRSAHWRLFCCLHTMRQFKSAARRIRNKVVINDGFVIGSIYDSTQRNSVYPRIDIGGTCRWTRVAHAGHNAGACTHENSNWTGVETLPSTRSNLHILHLL